MFSKNYNKTKAANKFLLSQNNSSLLSKNSFQKGDNLAI